MRRQLIFTFFTLIFVFSVKSQIGINTKSPIGIFNVVASTTGVNEDHSNTLVIDSDDNKEQAVVGLGGLPLSSASISLNEKNKAFLLNRVQLADSRGNSLKNPILNPVDGMVVFNTSSSGNPPNNVIPGLYLYNAEQGKWLSLEFTSSDKDQFDFTLNKDVLVPSLSSSTYDPADFLANAQVIEFKNQMSGQISEYIKLNATAAYAVALTLIGETTNTSTARFDQVATYVAIVRSNKDGSKEILDISIVLPVVSSVSNRLTAYYTIFGFNAYADDNIGLYVCKSNYANTTWKLNSSTKITLWNL